jgi:MFS family permease
LLSGYGARSAYLVASLFFIAGAALCALAPSMPVMLIGRTVQGFGGGLIFALSYAMINLVFEQRLWPRAMALISAMWGIATLVGPAVGGIFAELNAWRWAFGILLPIMALYAAFTFLILPKGKAQQAAAPLPTAQLLLLTVAVLVVSAGSLAHSAWINLAGIALSLVLMAWLLKREAHSRARLLPHGALRRGSNLRALFPAAAARPVAADLRLYRRRYGRRLDVVRDPQLRLARSGHSPGDRQRAAVRAGGLAGAGDPDADAVRRPLAGVGADRHCAVAGGIRHRLRLAAPADAHFAGGA